MTDHLALAPEMIEAMKRDLVDVISRYVEVDRDKIDVNFEQQDERSRCSRTSRSFRSTARTATASRRRSRRKPEPELVAAAAAPRDARRRAADPSPPSPQARVKTALRSAPARASRLPRV